MVHGVCINSWFDCILEILLVFFKTIRSNASCMLVHKHPPILNGNKAVCFLDYVVKLTWLCILTDAIPLSTKYMQSASSPCKYIDFFQFFSYVKLTLEPPFTRFSIKARYWLSNPTYRTSICCLLRFQGQLGCAGHSCLFHQLQLLMEKVIETLHYHYL